MQVAFFLLRLADDPANSEAILDTLVGSLQLSSPAVVGGALTPTDLAVIQYVRPSRRRTQLTLYSEMASLDQLQTIVTALLSQEEEIVWIATSADLSDLTNMTGRLVSGLCFRSIRYRAELTRNLQNVS